MCLIVLDLWDKCICLPGEISQIVTRHLEKTCPCYALNQLQYLLLVMSSAESVVGRQLLRLDEHGLVLSSPWLQQEGILISESLWPQMLAAWTKKQKWIIMDWSRVGEGGRRPVGEFQTLFECVQNIGLGEDLERAATEKLSRDVDELNLHLFTLTEEELGRSAVGTALCFGAQGPGFKPGLFHKAQNVPSLSASLAV